ncbi:MAG: prolipoprotein diacylglyceryl transferase [Candidatus Fraserbacteria bacterium RBG_16_55_9]|uniref:Phosphatidylglycerol--prolipoprotein diacylglyceryl transferase n=1 Tax=Fraserbacteria sp. (strain RBG_16_55_9) TaxID=1817864 RepID=A0A1F5V279_FRAXR|nr:MAG: prolipoprotein diacylglyceryl transferase [Candidatus Fraserbacteria bacterium RBG_16_55_9]
MSPVIVNIGPWSIRWYGLMYVVAIIVGIILANREVKRRNLHLTIDDLLDFVLLTIPIAIIFARLYYVAFRWDHYSQHLSEIYQIWQGGLAIHGGLIGGALALFLFSRGMNLFTLVTSWKGPFRGVKLSFWQFADLIAPAVVLGQALGRFGNFMNGDAFGTPTDGPFGIIFPSGSPAGQQYPELHIHPTMLYEMFGDLIIFGALWWLRTKPFKVGFLISLYAILYSALRFLVEFFRGDALCLLGGDSCVTGGVTFLQSLRIAQVISVLIFLAFAWFMFRRKLYQQERKSGHEPASTPSAS